MAIIEKIEFILLSQRMTNKRYTKNGKKRVEKI